MQLKTKKKIAREGLMLLAAHISIIIIFITDGSRMSARDFFLTLFLIFVLLHILYLIVRFAIWAIRTLKLKES